MVRDLVAAFVAGASSWKTYKKVMPWRNATAMNASSEQNTVQGRMFSKTHPDW